MSEPEMPQEMTADHLFSRKSMDSGNGPIDRFATKKLLDQKFSIVTNDDRWSFFFENNDSDLGLYKLENGDHWLFVAIGRGSYELQYMGTEESQILEGLGI